MVLSFQHGHCADWCGMTKPTQLSACYGNHLGLPGKPASICRAVCPQQHITCQVNLATTLSDAYEQASHNPGSSTARLELPSLQAAGLILSHRQLENAYTWHAAAGSNVPPSNCVLLLID